MKDIQVDSQGNLHCWKCGGNSFLSKRTLRSKVVFGVGALLTHKKLKCQLCGEYNQTGNAKPFKESHGSRLTEATPSRKPSISPLGEAFLGARHPLVEAHARDVAMERKTGTFSWLVTHWRVSLPILLVGLAALGSRVPGNPKPSTVPDSARTSQAATPLATSGRTAPLPTESKGAAATTPSNLVSFNVAARSSTAVILLVPASATEADLTNLVNALRTARGEGALRSFFPPTTPDGSKGPYVAGAVFVMSDPVWATTPRLNAFVNPMTSSISAVEKEFGKRVRAYYFFTMAFEFQEAGTIGYESEGHQYTATYKKLF